ncbi:MAG: LysR family transcriptional regulator [Pseudomonadota bacterium]
MQTRALKTLSKIEQIGSFATAADHLNMTLSAVSMQMKALEQELNVQIFDRTFRPPRLTPVGRAVAEKARSILALEDSLLAQCSQDAALSGAYRMGFVSTAGVRLLPRFLQNATARLPLARFEVETGLSEQLEERISQGRLDGAVVTASAAQDASLQFDVLREEELVYALPAGFSQMSLQEVFEKLPFIQFMPRTGIGKLIARHVQTHFPLQKPDRLVLDGIESIMQCVRMGIGFTLLPEPDVLRYGAEVVESRAVPDAPLTRQIVLITKQDGVLAPHRRVLASLFGD